MNLIDRLIGTFAPQAALERARARRALDVLTSARYDAATGTGRMTARPSATDADGAAGQRSRLAFIARDMVRNTAFAQRAQMVIANSVVGDGIIPKVIGGTDREKARLMEKVQKHLGSTDIDADGRCNLYGLQRLAMNAIVDAGEVLVRRRMRPVADGFALPFQLQVLEADFLDSSRDGTLTNGNYIRNGIEYDLIGRRVAYYLFREHPGASYWRSTVRIESARVPADSVAHIYRQDRPGQNRGVSWLAPVAMRLQDVGDYQDAQLMRQKIAACFAAFRVQPDGEVAGSDPAELSESLVPGRIQNLASGEDIRFAVPPSVQGYDEFPRAVLRSAAADLGLTYEALSGDLSMVNFSSARMGRMEMDRNISSWQWLMLIPLMMRPIGAWTLEAAAIADGTNYRKSRLDWVPPHRMLVDPAREIPALRDKVRAGFGSRSEAVRELGYDPEELLAEQQAEAVAADAAGLVFDSDPRRVSLSGVAQAATPDPTQGV